MSDVRIRPLRDYEELTACVDLQKKTWGAAFDDVVSAALMQVSGKIGGVSAGAFDGADALIGIIFGLTGIRDDVRVHWSHMLAVEPAHQGRGLGRLLKLYQLEQVRHLGVETMYWTFDPLEARNAHFNLTRLRAEIVEYVIDMYGSGTSSPLHRGLGTDRFIVRWDLAAASEFFAEELARVEWDGDEAIVSLRAGGAGASEMEIIEVDNEEPVVEIPSSIQSLKASDPDEARAFRTATRAAFAHYLSHGFRVVSFGRSLPTGRLFYNLRKDP